MARFRFLTADVFTDVPFGGNQLAVFPDARGLSDTAMLAITREFNFSETTFCLPATNSEFTRRVRIFTPGGELPFAGHPTVGTAHVLAWIGEIALSGDETRIVLEEGVGPVSVLIRARNGAPDFCQLSVAKLPEIRPSAVGRAELARMLSLDASQVHADWEPQGVSCGIPFLLVPLRDRAAVTAARLRVDLWSQSLEKEWARDIMLFALGGERAGSDIRARMFGPGVQVMEDPATGSACATLGGYLAARDARGDGTLEWVVEQGFEMGRPSMLYVEADKRGGKITGIRVGGRSVVMTEGTIEVPSTMSF